MSEFLASIRKALVPLVASGVVIALEAIGVELPGDAVEQIAAGIVTTVFVYLTPNEQ
jgi:hypothetical protein